jgi:hypothetical protein
MGFTADKTKIPTRSEQKGDPICERKDTIIYKILATSDIRSTYPCGPHNGNGL